MLIKNKFSKGDTLIEVLFAISAFSLVAVAGLLIMNQGTQVAQRSLEITLVRQEIDAQAETLRFLNSSYISNYKSGVSLDSSTPAYQWSVMENSIISTGSTKASDFGAVGNKCPDISAGSFILDTHNAKFISPSSNKITSAETFSQVYYDTDGNISSAEGIWIEAVRSNTINDNNQSNAGYVDFNIRACWSSPGSSVPVTIGTIVRLYEPR